ncbi:MAG TPA: beta-L-arabinofuranosidase domain-containing protein [Candidatus Binatia bacterium]|nr:beta-L-arabinofuranosidase domain-containing protein [Candidatus Binatia bacterium]
MRSTASVAHLPAGASEFRHLRASWTRRRDATEATLMRDVVASAPPPLAPTPFARLPLGAIRPEGWLREQLALAAAGLTGRLGDIWEDVGPGSAWLGGDGESWERGPYYARGLVAAAHALGDAHLAERARPWIEWTLASQRDDGSFGPQANRDWWARMPMLEALRLHHEATGDVRVPGFLARFFAHQLAALADRPLADWARPRGADNAESALWLHERTHDRALLALADLLLSQTSDWLGELGRDVPSDAFEFAHGVNRAMGFRAPAIAYLRSGDRAALDVLRTGFHRTLEHHGQLHGMFSSDEFLHGTGATQGTELCAIVETLSSLHLAQRVAGDAWIAEAVERIALNALPATIAADHRTHQYFQQVNQVACTPGPHGFGIHHENDLLFGPVTGYGCCAANMHIGWPLFVAHSWFATPDGGIAALQLAPTTVSASIGGTSVRITQTSAYPFEPVVRFAVRSERPVAFPLSVRIPGWAARAELSVTGGSGAVLDRARGSLDATSDAATSFALPPRRPSAAGLPAGDLVTVSRTWRDGDVLVVELPMDVRASRWERASVALERGPLVYALPLAEEWRAVAGTPPFCDYELHPRSEWRWALLLDPGDAARSVRAIDRPLARQPWARSGASTWLEVSGRRVPGWGTEDGSAGPVPAPPVAMEGEPERLVLAPYGCARLRVALFPLA